jgi:hypothetical protein
VRRLLFSESLNWRALAREHKNAWFYKLVKSDAPFQIEGMLMLTIAFEEMVQMNNIEIAPHNIGHDGEYNHIAGCLIAYACLKSFELGKNHYHGFLSFESKTVLMDMYQHKYGASHAMGHKMYFDNEAGDNLIQKYLNIQVKNFFNND